LRNQLIGTWRSHYLKAIFEHFQGSLEQFPLSANAKSLGRTRGILADAAGKQA
jgi:hypothetical protein